MQIIVRDNNVDQALRALKKKLQREGVYREMKLRRHYEKPSEKRARERAAAIRRARKLERKRVERDLHVGAQQRLVSMTLALRLARTQLGEHIDPAALASLDQASTAARARAALWPWCGPCSGRNSSS